MTIRSDDASANAARFSGFQLDSDPLLSRSTVEVSDAQRDDPNTSTALWENGRVVLVDERGRTPVEAEGRLVYWATTEIEDAQRPSAVLLGEVDGVGYWGVRSAPTDSVEPRWRDLRGAGGLLGDAEAGLLTTAVGLLGWHDRARYCAVCGATSERVRVGWARRCTGCGREEYPRTDPSMICLVHDGAERVLLARKPEWPSDRYSVLAGFVEVGESLEGCVRREVLEEVGVDVRDIRYLGSQPWPFPRSLMVGFAAVADPDVPLCPAEGEIAEAHWIERAHVRAALEADEAVRGLRMPPGISIAHRMLRGWAFAE